MDNLCHTLIGAALGEAGLKRTTRFGNATLMIASNLPDVDVLVFATATPSVAFRRGWTHGILADALLPQVATEWGWDPETFVEHTCVKAGLAPDAWKAGARMLVFEARIFADAAPAATS